MPTTTTDDDARGGRRGGVVNERRERRARKARKAWRGAARRGVRDERHDRPRVRVVGLVRRLLSLVVVFSTRVVMSTTAPSRDAANHRRAKRLAANREASAASRKRKRELERETRARVAQLEGLTAALASENAALKNALLELTCGVRMGGGEMMVGKVPLPRWDGGLATGVETPRGDGEALERRAGEKTTSTVSPSSSEDAFADNYTEFVLRTKRSNSQRVARAIEDAKTTRETARRRVGEGPTRRDEPRAERTRTIHMLVNALSRTTRCRWGISPTKTLTSRSSSTFRKMTRTPYSATRVSTCSAPFPTSTRRKRRSSKRSSSASRAERVKPDES